MYSHLFLAAYYETLIGLFKDNRSLSITDCQGTLVNPLTRYEFLSTEYQRYINSHNYSEEPKTYCDRDYVFEDRRLQKEAGKQVNQKRIDFFFAYNKKTRGNMFVFTTLHTRQYMSNVCTSKHAVTHQRCPGLVSPRLLCDIETCRYSGACHLFCCCLNVQGLNK